MKNKNISRILAAVMGILLLGIWLVTGTWVAAGLFLVYAILAIGMSVLLVYQKRYLAYAVHLPESGQKKEELEGMLTAVNDGLFPVSLFCTLHIENRVTRQEKRLAFPMLVSAAGEEKQIFCLSSEYCGCIDVKVESICLTGFFGLFSLACFSSVKGSTLVLPCGSVQEQELVLYEKEDWESMQYSTTKKGGDPNEITGIRNYRPGDSLRSIHWKLTAKWNDIAVKELGFPIQNQVLLLFETVSESEQMPLPSAVDGSVEMFITLAEMLLEDGQIFETGWYEEDAAELKQFEVISDDDMSAVINGILRIRKWENEKNSLCRMLEEEKECFYSTVFYITAAGTQVPDALPFHLTVYTCEGNKKNEVHVEEYDRMEMEERRWQNKIANGNR